MFRSDSYFRLIIELICSIILVVFFFGIALVAAITVGWAMALGMGIVFLLGFWGERKRT